MIRRLLPLSGPITVQKYAVLGLTLLFSQHLIVASLFRFVGA